MFRVFAILLTIVSAVVVLGGGGWLLFRCLRRAEDPGRVLFKGILTVLIAAGLLAFGGAGIAAILACAVCGVILSILWAPHLGALIASPLTSLYDGGGAEPEPAPLYSIALARRKQGRYEEALLEVQRQLDRFPTDIVGQLLLAEIQAENLNDLPAAQSIIEQVCEQPGHAPENIALALNELADWHLKFRRDTEAAGLTLAKIVALYPESELAQIASHRMAHLGSTEERLASQDRTPIHLRVGVRNVGLLKDSSGLQVPAEDPAAQATAYVTHLAEHPLDSEVREKLALIYADHYQRLDLAIDQLEQLVQQPNQPAKQVVHSLNLLADLQIKYAQDYEAARQTLQRIVDLYPELAAAENARQRLAHLRLELKGQDAPHSIKLGTYEQNIGLKKH